MTCPVALTEHRRGRPRRCARPLDRYGLCATHAADHDRLCDGCAKCVVVVWTCPKCSTDHRSGSPNDGWCRACINDEKREYDGD